LFFVRIVMADAMEQHDIIIIGAGLSGINTAYTLQTEMAHRNFAILEGRSVLGGTWNFFRYPGLRCDSSMNIYGFKWYPWNRSHMIASGDEITEYIHEAAESSGIMQKVRLNHNVMAVEWHSARQKWRLEVDANGTHKTYEANFIFACSGYFSYDKAQAATIPGLDDFQGETVHPQWWPEDLDYSGKRIVVIGSGATTITLLPTLAKTAGHVTMLQRSPSYIVSIPNKSPINDFIQRWFSAKRAHWLLWWKDALYELLFLALVAAFPNLGWSKALKSSMRKDVPGHIDSNIHFNPRHKPMEQRVCMCPDGDFFKTLSQDNCEIVTDSIDTVTKTGLKLSSGRQLDADIIVTATGLHMEYFGGIEMRVDGERIKVGDHYSWRCCMLDSVPNLAYTTGYIQSTWTIGQSLVTKLAIRVLKAMEAKKTTSATPVIDRSQLGSKSHLAFDTGANYVVKAIGRMPKTTNEGPWYQRAHPFRDLAAVYFGDIKKDLVFGRIENPNMKVV
jgi:cation diffusion facilitator CzcD-associated flavoprotein CzcO